MPAKKAETANDPFSVLSESLESAAENFEMTAANARESAIRAASATREAVGNLTYQVGFGVSFGLVFAGTYVVHLLPEQNSLRRGLVDGAHAADEAFRRQQEEKLALPAAAPKTAPTKAKPTKAVGKAKPPKKTSAAARAKVNKRADDFEQKA